MGYDNAGRKGLPRKVIEGIRALRESENEESLEDRLWRLEQENRMLLQALKDSCSCRPGGSLCKPCRFLEK